MPKNKNKNKKNRNIKNSARRVAEEEISDEKKKALERITYLESEFEGKEVMSAEQSIALYSELTQTHIKLAQIYLEELHEKALGRDSCELALVTLGELVNYKGDISVCHSILEYCRDLGALLMKVECNDQDRLDFSELIIFTSFFVLYDTLPIINDDSVFWLLKVKIALMLDEVSKVFDPSVYINVMGPEFKNLHAAVSLSDLKEKLKCFNESKQNILRNYLKKYDKEGEESIFTYAPKNYYPELQRVVSLGEKADAREFLLLNDCLIAMKKMQGRGIVSCEDYDFLVLGIAAARVLPEDAELICFLWSELTRYFQAKANDHDAIWFIYSLTHELELLTRSKYNDDETIFLYQKRFYHQLTMLIKIVHFRILHTDMPTSDKVSIVSFSGYLFDLFDLFANKDVYNGMGVSRNIVRNHIARLFVLGAEWLAEDQIKKATDIYSAAFRLLADRLLPYSDAIHCIYFIDFLTRYLFDFHSAYFNFLDAQPKGRTDFSIEQEFEGLINIAISSIYGGIEKGMSQLAVSEYKSIRLLLNRKIVGFLDAFNSKKIHHKNRLEVLNKNSKKNKRSSFLYLINKLENIAIELAVYEDVWPKLKEENSADNESEEQNANPLFALHFINQACFVVAALNQHALDSTTESQFIKALIDQFELFIACAVDGHSKRIANNIAIWMKCYIEKALKHNEINDYYLSIYDNLNLDSIACDREKEFALAWFYDYMYSDPAIRELHVLFKFMYLPNLLHRIYLMSEEEDLNEDDKEKMGQLIRRIETLSSPISLDMALYMNFVELLSTKNNVPHQFDLIGQTLSLFLKFLKDDSKLNYDCWERFSLIMCYFFEKNDLVNIATPRHLHELTKTLMEVNVLSRIESYEKMRQHLSCYFVENKTTNKKSKKKKKKAKTPKQMLSIELPEAVEIKPDPELDDNQCAKLGSTEEEAPVKSEVEIGANANHKDIEFPHTARNLFEFLKEKYKFYVYGGYIRDTLLEIKPDADIDIVISMPVEELGNLMCEFMAKYNIEIHSAGFCEYVPTLYILKINKPYKISFDIRAVENLDLSKEYLNCDFYINAIFYDPVRKEVKDPSSQGLQDVYDKKLRIIERKSDENPSKLSLQFNAKRLFRILTHQLKYDLKPDPILGWYFKAHAKDVTHLDADGIRLMLSKTLLFNDVISNFNFLLTSPLGDCLFPGFRMVLEKFPDYNHWFYSQLLSIKQVMRVGMRASIDDVLACVMVGYFQAGKVHQKAPGFFPAKVEPMILPSDMTNISCRSAYVVGLTNNFYNFSRKLRKQFAVQKH